MLVIPFLAALLCLALGFAWLLSIANVFFRDVEHLLAVIFLPWFFLTPVLYSLEQFRGADSHRWLITTSCATATRSRRTSRASARSRCRPSVPGAPLLVYIFVVGPLAALFGLWVVQRYEDRVAIEL